MYVLISTFNIVIGTFKSYYVLISTFIVVIGNVKSYNVHIATYNVFDSLAIYEKDYIDMP